MKRIFILGVSLFLPHQVMADDLASIHRAADINKCIPAGQVEKKYYYLERLKSWYVKSEINQTSAYMFWCQQEDPEGDFSHDYIIVISSEKGHPWSKCPPKITMPGSPTNLSLIGSEVSGEFDSGGYYLSCEKNKWEVQVSH